MFNRILELLGLTGAPATGGDRSQPPHAPDAQDVDRTLDDQADRTEVEASLAESEATIETEFLGTVVVVTFRDSRILEEERIRLTGKDLERVLDERVTSVVLDFKHVDFMASTMLTRLIMFRKRCLTKSIELRICSIAPNIDEVFALTRLNVLFVIDRDRTESLSGLLAPDGFPAPATNADWQVCADWWEERGDEAVARACRREANRVQASTPN